MELEEWRLLLRIDEEMLVVLWRDLDENDADDCQRNLADLAASLMEFARHIFFIFVWNFCKLAYYFDSSSPSSLILQGFISCLF